LKLFSMFDWKEYLNLAEQLTRVTIDTVSDEACLRTAVSRAYYAAFHIANDFAKNKDENLFKQVKNETVIDKKGNPRRRGDHEVVIEFLMRNSDNNIMEAGVKLEGLKKERVRCDYYDNIKNIFALAQKVILETKDVLDKISSI